MFYIIEQYYKNPDIREPILEDQTFFQKKENVEKYLEVELTNDCSTRYHETSEEFFQVRQTGFAD